jgi:polar amino acid transport system substrate-binding protein
MVRHSTLALSALVVAAACGLPRDSDGTTDRVRGGSIRVGVVANRPWVTLDGDSVGGIEPALVTELARGLGARTKWVRGSEFELLESLKRRELDIVIGGLTDAVPWKTEVALTRPYYADTIVIGVLPGRAVIRGLNGKVIAVESGDPVAAELRAKGATPLFVDDLARAAEPVAVPSWKLAALGRDFSGITVMQDRHVLAASQGENAWLVRLETLLHEREATIPDLLRAQRP